MLICTRLQLTAGREFADMNAEDLIIGSQIQVYTPESMNRYVDMQMRVRVSSDQ